MQTKRILIYYTCKTRLTSCPLGDVISKWLLTCLKEMMSNLARCNSPINYFQNPASNPCPCRWSHQSFHTSQKWGEFHLLDKKVWRLLLHKRLLCANQELEKTKLFNANFKFPTNYIGYYFLVFSDYLLHCISSNIQHS